MKISTGNSSASATTERIRSTPSAPTPSRAAMARPWGSCRSWLGEAVAIAGDRAWRPGVRASCAAVWPMMMISESGDGSAASPIVPISVPG